MSTLRLEKQSYIVTGAASGIGAAIVTRLLDEGAKVLVGDINVEAARQLVSALDPARRDRAVAARLDVTSRDEWNSAVSQAVEAFGALHGLVNNAGITRDKTMLKMADADYDAVLDTHLRGTWLGCQTTIPHLRKTQGAIVNISSSGRNGAFGQSNYSAAKAGIVGLTKTIALEQAAHGIRSNVVAPGAIDTPMTARVPDTVKQAWTESIAAGRLGQPSEIASAVAFLLSSDASFVNAHVLDVNGGEPQL